MVRSARGGETRWNRRGWKKDKSHEAPRCPFGVRHRSSSPSALAGPGAPLLGFDWPPEVCAGRASRLLVSCSRPGLARRRPARFSLCSLLPVRLISPASNSPGLVSPAEFDRNGPLHPQQMQPLPWGSFPFDACDRGGPHSRVCLARFVAPSGFVSPLGALLPPRPPRPYFMPRTSVGFTLRSLSLREEGACLPARSCPRAVDSNGARLPPRPSPGCRAFLPPEVRRALAERSRRERRCSLGFPPLQGFLPVRDGRRLPAGLLSRAWAASPPLRVSLTVGPVRLRRDHRPS